MIPHLNPDELRASLDDEVAPELATHLRSCATCQAQQEVTRQEQQKMAARLAFLRQVPTHIPNTQFAWNRFNRQNIDSKKEFPMFKKFFSSPLVRFGIVAACILAVALAFPTTRSLASRVLNLFRIQKVAVLPIDLAGLQDVEQDSVLINSVGNLISDSLKVTKEGSEPVRVADVAAAQTAAGFAVRLPANVPAAAITVKDGMAFQATIDREKAQALIDGAGRSDMVLDPKIDGGVISVALDSTVFATYGTCPNSDTETTVDPDVPVDWEAEQAKYKDCISILQMPSPLISVPDGLNMPEIAQLGLELIGMESEEAAAFIQTVDWGATLVIPLPKGDAAYSDVTVDGVTGKLIQFNHYAADDYSFLWVKDGVIYLLNGADGDTARGLALIASLP